LLAGAIPLAFLGVFFFYPLAAILNLSLRGPDGLDLSGFARLVESAYFRETVWFTLWQAALSTLLTVALALPGAYVFVRFRFPGRALLLALATLPFVLPTVVVAAAFNALVGPRGVINSALMSALALERAPVQLDRTLTLVLIAHIFYNYAVALRLIAGYWIGRGDRLEEAARSLGLGGWRLWWRVRLPMLRPAIFAAAALTFIFTFTSFGVVLILGGPRYATLEVEIYRQALNLFDLPMAAALSLAQIAANLALLLGYARLNARLARAPQLTSANARPPRTWGERVILWGNLAFMTALIFAPLAALLVRALGSGLGPFLRLGENPRGSITFVPPLVAVGNSLAFAAITAALAVPLGVLAALLLNRRGARWLDPLFMLPLATSAVTLGFGYLVAFSGLRSAALAVPLTHTLVALPFVVRAVLPALGAIAPSTREAARGLGASPWVTWWRVDLPLIWRGILAGAVFAFSVSMGEFGASSFLARPDTPTMPVVIHRLLGQPGAANYASALAMSAILLVICGAAFIIIERVRLPGERIF
jgi:thiamine transport system permease protein